MRQKGREPGNTATKAKLAPATVRRPPPKMQPRAPKMTGKKGIPR